MSAPTAGRLFETGKEHGRDSPALAVQAVIFLSPALMFLSCVKHTVVLPPASVGEVGGLKEWHWPGPEAKVKVPNPGDTSQSELSGCRYPMGNMEIELKKSNNFK